MYVIGLTGGIGSGKTTVANLFSAKGIEIIDTDLLARDVTQPATVAFDKIVEKFGKEILLRDGTLNRPQLRKSIFQNKELRLWLESLIHPQIRKLMQDKIAHARSPYCIVVIPLLFEGEKDSSIQRTLVIDALENQQISRAQRRDNATIDDIQSIMDSQISRHTRLTSADDVIYNHGDIAELNQQVEKLHHFYLTLAAQI